MARYSQVVLTSLLLVVSCCGAGRADDVVATARIGTMQGASAALTVVSGETFCFMFGCSGSSGLALDGEVGLGGIKGGFGIGIADRKGGVNLVSLKASVLRAWDRSITLPDASVFVGPELQIAAPWGAHVGAFKRVDASGWRLSAGILRSF